MLFLLSRNHDFEFVRKWKTGKVHINNQSVNDEPYIAFGDEKMSDFGRFGRTYSLDVFTTYQWISEQVDPKDYPF